MVWQTLFAFIFVAAAAGLLAFLEDRAGDVVPAGVFQAARNVMTVSVAVLLVGLAVIIVLWNVYRWRRDVSWTLAEL